MKYLIKSCVLCLLLISQNLLAEVVVIVHPANSISSISKADLGRLFLSKTDTFPGGAKATPYNTPFFSSSREAFDLLILKRQQSQMKAFWGRELFSGNSTPPEEVADDAAMLQKVASDQNAIGYIHASLVNDSVKTITLE